MIDLDAIERRAQLALDSLPPHYEPHQVPDWVNDALALVAEVRGLRAALEARIEKVAGEGGELDQAFEEGRARGRAEASCPTTTSSKS